MIERKSYRTSLTDAQWQQIAPHLPPCNIRGRPRRHRLREIVDAILYVLKTGCHWYLLSHDFPPYKTVYHYFRRFRKEGVWQRMHVALVGQLRTALRREPSPSAAWYA